MGNTFEESKSNSFRCISDSQCKSGIYNNYYSGGTYYCWPKEKCGGAVVMVLLMLVYIMVKHGYDVNVIQTIVVEIDME